jgi:hypothetical protein
MRVWLGLLFALALGGAAAHAGYDFVAAPDGDLRRAPSMPARMGSGAASSYRPASISILR